MRCLKIYFLEKYLEAPESPDKTKMVNWRVSRISVAMKNLASKLPQSSLRTLRKTILCDKSLRSSRSLRLFSPATLYGWTFINWEY